MKHLFFSIILLSVNFFNEVYCIQILQRCSTGGISYNLAEGNHSERYLVSADGTGGVVKFNPYPDSNFCDSFSRQKASARFPTRGSAHDVLIVQEPFFIDPVLFIADGDSGLSVFISDTGTDWVVKKRYPIAGKSKSLALHQKSILVAGDSGLFIFSLPCSAGTYCYLYQKELSLSFREQTFCLGAEDVAVEGSKAYVITTRGDIVFCDLEPTQKVTYVIRTMNDTCAIIVKDGIAYTVSSGSFSSYDVLFNQEISNPPIIRYHTPLFRTSLFGGHGEDVVIFNNLAYIAVRRSSAAHGFNGLVVYDIAERSDPRFVDSCSTPGSAYGILVDSNAIYLADGDSGIAVLSHPRTSSTSRSTRHYPGGRKTIDRVSGNKTGAVFRLLPGVYGCAHISVFTVNGIQCRTLRMNGNSNEIKDVYWDYSDEAGRKIAPGMYFAVMEVGGTKNIIPFARMP